MLFFKGVLAILFLSNGYKVIRGVIQENPPDKFMFGKVHRFLPMSVLLAGILFL